MTEDSKTPEPAERTWESYHGDPEPHIGETINGPKRLHVHWYGYVHDPGPTDAKRAEGETVIVYGDNMMNPGMLDEYWLGPSSHGLPEPWDARALAMPGPSRHRGGVAGSRFLSDGHGAWRVPDAVYHAALKFSTIPEVHDWTSLFPNGYGTSVDLADAVMGERNVKLAATIITIALFETLIELGVESVVVYGEMDPIVAVDVAVIMPVRVGDGDHWDEAAT